MTHSVRYYLTIVPRLIVRPIWRRIWFRIEQRILVLESNLALRPELKAQLENLHDRLSELFDKVNLLQELSDDVAALSDLSSRVALLSRLPNRVMALQAEIDRLTPLQAALDNLKTRATSTSAALGNAVDRSQQIKKELDRVKADLASMSTTLDELVIDCRFNKSHDSQIKIIHLRTDAFRRDLERLSAHLELSLSDVHRKLALEHH